MTGLDDLQADLDQLAADLNNIAHGDFDEACPFCDIADRLRNLLTDRDLDVPPLTSEIIAWLDADPTHAVKWWNRRASGWSTLSRSVLSWRGLLATYGDQRQYGYRLGVREPATERVRLDQIIGRDITYSGGNGRVTVRDIGWHPASRTWRWYDRDRYDVDADAASGWLKTAPDGTVEVLKDDSK